MSLVATLLSSPRTRALASSLADKACAAVGASTPDWLAEGIACDVTVPIHLSGDDAEEALREAIGGSPLDIVVQPAATRRKKILLADMDSTMIGQECIDELAEEAGIKAHVAAITARAMNGEIAFEPALRERVALLRGLPVSVIEKVIAERITLTPGGRELVRTMRANGGYTALVSGGFTAFTTRVAELIGFDENRANILIEEDGHLAGKVAEPVLGQQAKVDALVEIAMRLGLTPQDAMAVGDGANDLAMIRLAGSGVALHAKPSVAAQAAIRIDHGDLTALLYIQGYRQAEFVT